MHLCPLTEVRNYRLFFSYLFLFSGGEKRNTWVGDIRVTLLLAILVPSSFAQEAESAHFRWKAVHRGLNMRFSGVLFYFWESKCNEIK